MMLELMCKVLLDTMPCLVRCVYTPLLPLYRVAPASDAGTLVNVRVEDGKLFYENKWFHKGQQVFVESKEHGQER